MNPKVSIIVPIYNVAEYLPQCLDSLINQTFSDIEIICFNDASTDNSLKILNDYAKSDSRIRVIDSPINIRQGGGRNRGIMLAASDYIMFVDSDDWVSSKFVELSYNAIIKTDADIVTADYYESLNDRITEISLLGKKLTDDTEKLKNRILRKGCRLWTSIFNKNLFLKNNLFFPERVAYEDVGIGIPLFLSAKRIVKIDEPIYYYRIDNTSTTRGLDNWHYFDRLETLKVMLNNCKRLNLYDKYKPGIDEKFFVLYYINTLLGAVKNFSKIPFDQIDYILKSINNYISPSDQRKLLKKQSKQIILLVELIRISPRSGSNLVKCLYRLKK